MREPPLNAIKHFARMHRGNAKRVESSGAVIEEEDIRPRILAVASIDPFIFPVVNPESIKDHRQRLKHQQKEAISQS